MSYGTNKLFIFDLIILDIMMPKQSGIEFLKYLRDKDSGTPVLMLWPIVRLIRKVIPSKVAVMNYC